MNCPFVSSVSTGLFKRSNITLASALNHCPFIRQQRSLTITPENNILTKSKTAVSDERNCPYIHGQTVERPRCPVTNIETADVPKSDVLQDIYQETPGSIRKNPVPGKIPEVWAESMHIQLQKKKDEGTYRNLMTVNKSTQRAPLLEKIDSKVVYPLVRESYCSNDYLSMSSHPTVIKAAVHAAEKHGTGAGGTRNISGTSELTVALEREISSWHQAEDALIFNGCYPANDATLSTLLGRRFPGAQCFSDSGNHASMIQGMLRGKREQADPSNRLFTFRHDSPEHLEELLREEYLKDPYLPRIVAFESVHSMGGNIQRISELADVAHQYGALTFCDEVHAVGLYGHTGAGIAEVERVRKKIDIISGTLGKGVGGFGGYIAGPSLLVDQVRQHAPGFIFTTAMPPTVLASNIASIRILKGPEGRQLRDQHWEAVNALRDELDDFGIEYKKPARASHITAVELNSTWLADQVMDELDRRGFYVQAIKSPTVPLGEEMLRLTASPRHLRNPQTIPRFASELFNTINAYQTVAN